MIEDGRTTVTLRDVETAQAVTGPDDDLPSPMRD